jgi:acyl-CoA thioesterase-1
MPVPIQPLIRLVVGLCWLAAACQAHAEADAIRIVALGDSLTAGPGLEADRTFPVRLEAALRARGHLVTVVDAGVSGDTARDGLARLDWSVGPDADAVIVELGANDALRGTDPDVTRDALDAILARLSDRGLPVLLAGMKAPPNLGDSFAAAFNPIYGDLADKHGAVLYPFFLDGVAGDSRFNQNDGMHPNAEGIDVIVERILPSVEAVIARVDESR